jgi:hypothetical protein
LDPEPFTSWIERNVKRYGGQAAFAESLGVDERTIRRYNPDSASFENWGRIHRDTADRLLCLEGNTMLWELWPHLAE